MSFKASKPDARILILQIVIASILEFGLSSCHLFFCERVERSNRSEYSSLAVWEISIFSRKRG